MNGSPATVGSMRLRHVLWPALRGDPVMALAGLYWLVTRRRVRGWARLMTAAAKYPSNYACWITHGEVRAFAEFRQSHRPEQGVVPVIAWIVNDGASDEDAVSASATSVRRALGEDVPVRLVAKGVPFSSVVDEAQGAWVLPVLAGDLVSPELGDVIPRAIGSCPGAALIYWDEDQLAGERRCEPWIKPGWGELLFGQLGGLAGASLLSLDKLRALAAEPGLACDRSGIERAAMRLATDPSAAPPVHVPLVLTHRSKWNAPDIHRAASRRPRDPAQWPSLSILVPTRDRPDLLEACVQGIRRTSYPGDIQLIIIDNGSVDPVALAILEGLEKEARTTVIRDPGPFNFSRLNNRAAAVSQGEFLCLLNNDVEPLGTDWLSLMITAATEEGVGAVGAQLLFPSGRIQHAGVAIGIGGAAGHVQKSVDPNDRRFWAWHRVTREVSAVTAAAMVVRRSTFLKLGGFDEEAFPVAFNDVDLCLRLKASGLRNLYVAEARLLHREFESRGDDRAPARAKGYAAELKQLQERWHTKDFVDPHFSPLFTRLSERCVLAP